MKKKEGYTIVEIVVTIAIMLLVIGLIVPNLSEGSKKTKEKIYDSKIDEAKRGAYKYGVENIDYINEECTNISIGELIQLGFIEGDDRTKVNLINPKTDESMNEMTLCVRYDGDVKVDVNQEDQEREKYSVELEVEKGRVVGDRIKKVEKGGVAKYTIEVEESYKEENIKCDDEDLEVSLEGKKVEIRGIKKDTKCIIGTSIKTFLVEVDIIGGRVDSRSKRVEIGGNVVFSVEKEVGVNVAERKVEGEGCLVNDEVTEIRVDNVRRDKICKIELPKNKYIVTASISGGSLDSTSKEVEHGSNATFTITANPNYDITRATVSGEGCTLSSDKRTLTVSNVTSNRSCSVTVPLKQYTLSIVVNNGSTSPSSAVIEHAGSKTYTISASTGYTTTGMTVSCTGNATKSVSGSTVTISNVTSTQTCTVSTVKKTYAVNVSSNNTSYGTVSPMSTTISHGSSATITLSPKTGYKYSSNNCGGTVSGNTMTISNITSAKTCTVTFAIKTYTVSVSVTNGSSSPTSKTVNHGSNGTFTITPSSGYKLDGATVSGTGCSLSGSTLTVSNVTSARSCAVKITTIDITSTKYLYGKILSDHPTVKTRTDFSAITESTATSKVIYKETSRIETGGVNNKPVYYFAGYVADNWVKFAGFYWKILRTNEDGSIRLIYHAVSNNNEPGGISSIAFDQNGSTSYMYNGNSSTIKTSLDNWYESNILDSYNSYINAGTIYCNDNSNSKNASYSRMSNKKPSYKCGQSLTSELYSDATSQDKYSKNTSSGGNGLLKYPIGLITADEAMFAGLQPFGSGYTRYNFIFSRANSAFGEYKYPSVYWTMSPAPKSYCGGEGEDSCYKQHTYTLGRSDSDDEISISSYLPTSGRDFHYARPVLSLKSCVQWKSGNGTASSPYEISITSTCSSAVN